MILMLMILMMEIQVNKNLVGLNLGFGIILQETLRVLVLSVIGVRSRMLLIHTKMDPPI